VPTVLPQSAGAGTWFAPHAWPALALPAPVRKFLGAQAVG
jgi:hypothetical protein